MRPHLLLPLSLLLHPLTACASTEDSPEGPTVVRGGSPPAVPAAARPDLEALLAPCAAHAEAAVAGPLGEDLDEEARTRLAAAVLGSARARLAALPVAPDGTPFPMETARAERQVCAFEAWKAQVYVSSGVFPKVWFGYLDGQWDTRADELRLREVVDGAVPLANAELARQGHAFRISDQELVATWLAEGGTLLLGDPRAAAGSLDPIMDIGLDSLVRGFGTWAPLVAELDAAFGTDIGTTVVAGGRYRTNFDLTESILGTLIMLCDERALLADKLAAEGRTPQHERPLDEQFILASLHYNSGLLFSDARVAMVRDLRTADYLHGVSVETHPRRDLLPVLPPGLARERLRAGEGYPAQWTSWNAVYHVLQRSSSWRALSLFTDWFEEDGELAPFEPPPPVYPS